MHTSSKLRMAYFVKKYLYPLHNEKTKVLDVGSYDVNGSYKQFFPSTFFDYVGLDMAEGPNVDYTPANPYVWDALESASFDVVISGQAFEHIEFPWLTMQEMARVLKVGGLMCILVPCRQTEHRYPLDCYRYFSDGMIALARWTNLTPLHASTNSAPPHADKAWYNDKIADSFLIARKDHEDISFDVKKYAFEVPTRKDFLTGFIPNTGR